VAQFFPEHGSLRALGVLAAVLVLKPLGAATLALQEQRTKVVQEVTAAAPQAMPLVAAAAVQAL
jgi:hypothetical protein